MTTFNQWHEADSITFHSETNVYFSDCASNKLLSLNALLKLTSDFAVQDYAKQGITRDVLSANSFAILVSRLSFRFHTLPSENQRITIITWEEKPEPLQFRRAYELVAQDGTALISGISSWLLVDPKARRILPLNKFTLRKPNDIQKPHNCMEAQKIILPESMEAIDQRTIRYSDIDANGHVNNARYGAFIMDSLPAQYREKTFTDFRINFSKEALLGQMLNIFAHFDDDAKKITLAGKTEDGNSFESELYYK